jgi:hypothetical protein
MQESAVYGKGSPMILKGKSVAKFFFIIKEILRMRWRHMRGMG